MSEERMNEIREEVADFTIDDMVDLFFDFACGLDVGYTDEELNFIEEVIMQPYWDNDFE